jgi:hypothetical protein
MTYGRNVDASDEVRAALYLCPVQTIQHLANVRCQGREDLWGVASHAHEADRRFWVCTSLRGEDHVDGVLLCFPS